MSKFMFQYYMDYEDGKMARFNTTGELEIPVNIFIDNVADYLDAKEGPCSIEVNGMGSSIQIFESEEAYYASDMKLDVISMIPMGTFPADPNNKDFEESPRIIFSGKALRVEWDPEAEDGNPNYRVLIETLEMQFYLYLRSDQQIKPGYVLHGVAWLFGDLEM